MYNWQTRVVSRNSHKTLSVFAGTLVHKCHDLWGSQGFHLQLMSLQTNNYEQLYITSLPLDIITILITFSWTGVPIVRPKRDLFHGSLGDGFTWVLSHTSLEIASRHFTWEFVFSFQTLSRPAKRHFELYWSLLSKTARQSVIMRTKEHLPTVLVLSCRESTKCSLKNTEKIALFRVPPISSRWSFHLIVYENTPDMWEWGAGKLFRGRDVSETECNCIWTLLRNILRTEKKLPK